MAAKRVIVVPYDEKWEQSFLDIKAELRAALGASALGIEHVGSTAVPGLSAKPVIDIDVVIADRSGLADVIAALGGIGYVHQGDLGVPGREAFTYEGKEHLPKHHLYVCPRDSAELRRHLAFRDYLRAHPGAAGEYGRLKEEGAALYPYDIGKYIEHKSPFIGRILSEIGGGTGAEPRMIQYRKLTRERLGDFIRMRIRQLREEGATEEFDLAPALRDYYERHMADGSFVSWLALDGDAIVATGGMSFVEKPPYFGCPSGRIGLLSSMFTEPAYRRQGIARELLSRVVEEARAFGCGAVQITASDMGVPLYADFGFTRNENFMQYRLPPKSGSGGPGEGR